MRKYVVRCKSGLSLFLGIFMWLVLVFPLKSVQTVD